jgi:multiple sugar transport system substrate-binding protein
MLPVWWWVRSQLTDPENSPRSPTISLASRRCRRWAGPRRTTFTNTWIFGVTEGSDNPDAAIEYLGWLTDPALERDVLPGPRAERAGGRAPVEHARPDEVNARWGGIHSAAADALETAEGIEFGDDWLRIVEVLETAISSLASGEQTDVQAALDAAAEEIAASAANPVD